MVIICPSCGAENPDHADYCNLCMSTVGFECAEYTSAAREEGFTTRYPSSFSEDAPSLPPEDDPDRPAAEPVDIGRYGERSGEKFAEAPPDEHPSSGPVDVGRYGEPSGQATFEPPPLASEHGGRETGRRRRWKRR